MQPVLAVENLTVLFHTYAGTVKAVRDVSFDLGKGEILGIVGESGCGKSVTANAIMGLIPSPPGEIAAGRILFGDADITKLDESALRRIRGNAISMIFQDPMTSLNPVLTVGTQLIECFLTHQRLTKRAAAEQAIHMLKLVGIPAPEARMNQYPHQLSGGMRQRVMIATALAMNPAILIADEPTTALDVTVQAQIIELMQKLNRELTTSIILISHDLGVIAGLCNRVIVMYAGQVVEAAPVAELFANPRHPYTVGLLESVPRLDAARTKLESIEGQPPDLLAPPTGCAFQPRCHHAMQLCGTPPPLFTPADGHTSRCWLEHEACPHPLPMRRQKAGEPA
ncbi:MAG: ABC transporter ATP-binding protein [Negativicutes bacterium]|nr:ABC transporter ATP-binding protein [Negativicutes bacterium]